jgi:hypothetical protein
VSRLADAVMSVTSAILCHSVSWPWRGHNCTGVAVFAERQFANVWTIGSLP